MDGVSSAVGLITSGYTAYKKVAKTRKEFKKSPERLQSLEDTRNLIRQLLDKLPTANEGELPGSVLNTDYLRHLRESAERCFDDVDKVLNKVRKENSTGRGMGEYSIRRVNFLLSQDNIRGTSDAIKDLRDTSALLLQL